MEFEPVDRTNEPQTDEFEKLEFLPEQPADVTPEPDDTAEIVFTPEEDASPEPPVSFSSLGADDPPASPELDFGADTPFELYGTSLFDDPELDNELDPVEDLEF